MTDKKPAGRSGGAGGSGAGGKGGPRGLQKKVRVKTRDKRTISSARWLERQLNDPYVAAAKVDGYHSRAAYKLLQMQEDLDIFKPGMRVIDLGAAPGGWTQVVCDIVKPGQNGGKVVAIDYLEMKPVAEAEFFQMDFTDDEAPGVLKKAIGGKAHVVMSDMAPPTIGHKQTDHLRIMALAEMGYEFALEVLLPGGTYLAKVFQGGAERDLLNQMKKDFTKVKHIKPPASRKDSAEMYVVALGFRG